MQKMLEEAELSERARLYEQESEAAQGPKLTQEEIQAVAAHANAFRAALGHDWKISGISHLYLLKPETFAVSYTNGATDIFCREAWTGGELTLATTWTYWASNNFADAHDKREPGDTIPQAEIAQIGAQ